MLTAEKAKGKYVYYHCSFGKGRHKVAYLPVAKLAKMLEAATYCRKHSYFSQGRSGEHRDRAVWNA